MKFLIIFFFLFASLYGAAQTKDAYDAYSDSMTRIGQAEKVIPYFENELKRYPNNEAVLRKLGFLHIEKNQLDLGEKYYLQAIEVNPKCGRCYLNLGRIYGKRNDSLRALGLYNKAINTDPIDALLYVNRAKFKLIFNDKAGSLIDYNKAIKLEPNNASFYIERALYNMQQGYFATALVDLDKAVDLEPTSYYPYFQRSSAYYETKRFTEALADINQAMALDSTPYELLIGRAAIYAAMGDPKQSIDDYTKASQKKPEEFFPIYNRAHQHYALEDMDASCRDMKASYAILKKFDPESAVRTSIEHSLNNYCDDAKASYYYQRGIAQYNLGVFEKAVQHYTAGLKKFPNNSMMLSFRGNAYLALRQDANALTDYYAAIKNKANLKIDIALNQPHTGVIIKQMDAYVNSFLSSMQISIAEAKFALGKYSEALAEINKGISMEKNYKEIGKEVFLNVRANIYIALSKNKEALNDLNNCIEINPKYHFSYINSAIVKVNLANKMTMKSALVTAEINNRSFNANWMFPLNAKAEKANASIIAALLDCDKAIELEPAFSYGYFIRGQIKKMLGEKDYCYDLLKAQKLGYIVSKDLLLGCLK